MTVVPSETTKSSFLSHRGGLDSLLLSLVVVVVAAAGVGNDWFVVPF